MPDSSSSEGSHVESDAEYSDSVSSSDIDTNSDSARSPCAFDTQDNNTEEVTGDRVLSRRLSQRTSGSDVCKQPDFSCWPKVGDTEGRASTSGVTFPTASSIQRGSIQEATSYVPFQIKCTGSESLQFNNFNDKVGTSLGEAVHLEATEEVQSLFQFIEQYKPRSIEIETVLKPFIPEYIPAIGGVDDFIKVPRPDGCPDYLGLKVLDERGPRQSGPAVITLQLRSASLQPSLHPLQVASVQNPDKNPKKLDAWIGSIKDLYRAKPPLSVAYSKPMPDIQKLMQEWPPEIEKVLSEIQPFKDGLENLDVDLSTFADICCSILDIPVYKSRVESLHLVFSLYLELRNRTSSSSQADGF